MPPASMITNEREILLRVAVGDEKAFALLVDQYRRNIYTSALRMVHTTVLAEEVLQDVFLKVWLQRSTLPTLDSFPAWLNRVARNTIYTAFKKSLKEATVSTEDWDMPSPHVTEHHIQSKEYETLLKEAVERLPLRQRQTWLLIREEGLKRHEAAAQLGISPETIKFNLEEAVRKVRAYCLSRLPLAVIVLLTNIK